MAAHHRRLSPLPAVVVACAVLLGVLVHQSQEASSTSIPTSSSTWATSTSLGAPPAAPASAAAPPEGHGRSDGATALDDRPEVARLDPKLLAALRRAAADAADRGIVLHINSGWRSPEHQQHLLDQAVAKYGSLAEAERWVATPATSLHVSGDAVDVGPPRAAAWLADHGARYGLCGVYRNEPWHFELRPGAADHGCPRPYADPTEDPRLQR
jgi:hypothetical protein